MAGKQDFEVKVSKNEVVAAGLPVQEHWLPQSNLDLLLPPIDFSVFFCYKKPTPQFTFGSMVSVLKKALSQTLVSYYAFAGEMVQNIAEEPELLCNNRGVDFVEAFAEIELQELNLYNPDESIQGKLVPTLKQGVLAVQATKLKCGGLVLGCTFDHRVADAYSANLFFITWMEIAQSRPPSTKPSFRRSLLYPRRPGGYDPSINDFHAPISELSPPKDPRQDADGIHRGPISRIYYVKAEHVIQLQSLANDDKCVKEKKRTKIEAFSAFLWKTLATGTGASNGKYCRLGIVVDGRTRLGDGDENKAMLMSTYFGNVLSIPFEKKQITELTSMPLSCVANAVHKFLEKAVRKEYFLGLIDYVEAHRPELTPPRICFEKANSEEPAFVVSSGKYFPVKKMDFGWGIPAFGSYYFPWGQPGYVMPMASATGDGDWVVYMQLLKEQVEVIETSASHIFEPMTNGHLNS